MAGVIALFGTSQVQTIVVLIAIDVVLGIIAALYRKEFDFGKLCKFMREPVLAYIFGFVIIEIVAQALPSLAFILSVAFVLVVIALLASIFGNLGKLGLPLPRSLKK